MGAFRSAMMPLHGRNEGLFSMTGIPPHPVGIPHFPQHLLPFMPGLHGMLSFGKSAVIATPLVTRLHPVYHSDLLEGIPVSLG